MSATAAHRGPYWSYVLSVNYRPVIIRHRPIKEVHPSLTVEHVHELKLNARLTPRSPEGWQQLPVQYYFTGTEESPPVFLKLRPQRTQRTPT